LCSFKEAVFILEQRGRSIDVKTLRTLTYHFSDKARCTQQAELALTSQNVSGMRCAVSVDGGRIRIRTAKKGKKTKKNRQRFHADWKEPKLLHIWVLADDGTICKSFAPWIDGTMNGPDAVFMLLAYYLTAIGITEAKQVLFIADGAPWIWLRIPALIVKLGLNPAKVRQIVDFYHAVEHLNNVAALRKGWNEKRRRQWVSRQTKYLWTGRNEDVVQAVKEITNGRNSKLINREMSYFENNLPRMQYAKARNCKLPIGSGPMESAIRRVINLRMKGNGIFWLDASAESMIMLRSFYKAGRWDDLFQLATTAVIGTANEHR
jgi:hypothetical protein